MLVVYIYPLIWVTLSGFKTSSELLLTSFQPPKKFRLENFIGVWKVGISDFYLNSIIITTASCVFTTICASLAAFCLSRYRFKTRKFWFMFLLCGLMLAPQVSLISNFKLLQFFHLYDTYLALILTYTAFRIPFTMFLVWSYFMTLPLEIEEAACIDGCTSIQTLVMIVVPMSRPIIATSILLTARYVWNDFLFSLVFTRSQSLRTIPYGLYSLRGESGTNWGYLMAGMTLAAIPMIILFICTQKQFIRGLAVGGVKG
jgi:raffinose/stachyose/melibiose transport system permease protein